MKSFQTPKGIPKFKVNERVQCLWLDTNTPYQGTISRKEGDAYDVNYDDGDFEANGKCISLAFDIVWFLVSYRNDTS